MVVYYLIWIKIKEKLLIFNIKYKIWSKKLRLSIKRNKLLELISKDKYKY